jgi:Protein of unknown function (DUF3987)
MPDPAEPRNARLLAAARQQPGFVERSSGMAKFQCPACRAEGHDTAQDNAGLFVNEGKWGCAVKPQDHWRAIGEALGAFSENPPPRDSTTSPRASRATDPWPPLEPIATELPPVASFEVDRLLPKALAPWVEDVAARSQCPPDFVGIGVVIAAAAVIGRQLAIRPKRHDDWTVVPNLWGVGIGKPGLLKTAAMQESLRGVYRLVAQARARHREALAEWKFRVASTRAQRAAIEKQMKAAAERHQPLDPFRAALEAAAEPMPPTERRFIVNDATIEKVGVLLNENPNGLLQFRDELGGFLRLMDREGHENDRAFYCEAWNGTGSYRYDRISRGTLDIEAACISILGGIQPMPLEAYLRETFADGQDDGLIQRFQLMVYPDIPATWQNVDRWPDTEARRLVGTLFERLETLDLGFLGAGTEDRDALPYLRFAPEAQIEFDAWRSALERRLRTDDASPILLTHLAKYRSLSPSLALVFHVIDCLAAGRGGPVSRDALARALAWLAYLEPHARRVYDGVLAPGQQGAATLARRLTAGGLASPFTVRTVRLKGWTGLGTPEEILSALDRLDAAGWVRREHVRHVAGGRPTTQFHVSPHVRPSEPSS